MYAIQTVSNGNFAIAAEGITDINLAKTNFHNSCSAYWNASDVELAAVSIVDEQLRIVDGYHEVIDKRTPAQNNGLGA